MLRIFQLFLKTVLCTSILHSRSQDVLSDSVSAKYGSTNLNLLQTFQISSEFRGVVSFTSQNLKSLVNQRKRRQLQSGAEPPLNWTEHWEGHQNILKRVYWNKSDHVVIYLDQNVYDEPTWVYNFISKAWAYMTKTYGIFGSELYLYAVLHHTTYGECLRGYSMDNGNKYDGRNVLDCGPEKGIPWTTRNSEQRDRIMDLLTNRLAPFVENSSKQRRGSPSLNVWRLTHGYWRNAWIDIFTYDVYMGLNMTAQANLYNVAKLTTSGNNPRPNTFWFKDWFLPIYTQFGGSKLLNRYFELLNQYFPTQTYDDKIYYGKLNMGEFVHFWSGAAGHNLTDIADRAFGWNMTYMDQMDAAIIMYPEILQLYNCSGCDKSTFQESDTTAAANHRAIMTQDADSKPELLIFSISAGVLLVIMASGCVIFVFFHKRKILALQGEVRSLTMDEVKEFFEGDGKANIDEEQSTVQSMPFVTDFELTRDQIIVAPDKVIGSGQFGCVIHGVVRTAEGELIPVAVKTVKRDVEVLYFKSMLSEAKIMAYLGIHENIVRLVGTFTTNIQNREIFIALELSPLGDLNKYLKKYRKNYRNLFATSQQSASNTTNQIPKCDGTDGVDDPLSTLDLLKFSHQISNAMVYLTEKKVIHGDLAARNVLLTANRVAQISDFGLSRQLINYSNIYEKTTSTPLPWRWMAIESLKDMKFSIKSDVWAFGVTLWEIFSLAETPYPGWLWDYDFVDKLVAGDRLKMPIYGSSKLYALMQNCWKLEPSDRFSFLEIREGLGEMISDLTCFGDGVERNTLQRYVYLTTGKSQD